MINENEKAEKNVDARAIIQAVLSHVGMRAPSFAKAIGINYQRIFDLQNGRTKKFNPGIVNLICEKFPEINKTYLYTGEGDIVRKDYTEVVPPGTGPTAQLGEMIAMQQKLMSMLQSLADRESSLLERLMEVQERERVLNEREIALDKKAMEIQRLLEENGLKKGSKVMGA